MRITETKIKGVYLIKPDIFNDERGIFVKPFNIDSFKKKGLATNFEENFYSISKKGVARGMHFQKPPNTMAKLVYVSEGSILDIVLDVRKNSPTYRQHITIEISKKNHLAVYIPAGCAHGFLSLEDNSCTVYLQETVHSVNNEQGVNIQSLGLDLDISNLIISERDKKLPSLKDFDSPFINNQ